MEFTKDVPDLNLQIDPTLFEKYDIRKVPAVVCDNGEVFDVIYGNLKIREALNRIYESNNGPQTVHNKPGIESINGRQTVHSNSNSEFDNGPQTVHSNSDSELGETGLSLEKTFRNRV